MNVEDEPERSPQPAQSGDPDRRTIRGSRARQYAEAEPARAAAPARLDPASDSRDMLIAEQTEKEMMTQYFDDLEAANRFKTFLLGSGAEVPFEVLDGLARLTDQLIVKDVPMPPESYPLPPMPPESDS